MRSWEAVAGGPQGENNEAGWKPTLEEAALSLRPPFVSRVTFGKFLTALGLTVLFSTGPSSSGFCNLSSDSLCATLCARSIKIP